jgi:tubulin-specific chaperone D
LFQYQSTQWCLEFFEGLVSSADTGSEDLIRVSRAALANFCDGKTSRGEDLHDQMDLKGFVCESLFEVAKRNISNDRVLVPTLEVISFLFDTGIIQRSNLQ